MADSKQTTIEAHLPQGYTMRAATYDDIPALVKLFHTVSIDRGHPEQISPDDIRQDWDNPKFDVAASVRVVEDASGAVIAIVSLWDTSNIPVMPEISVNIHPAHRGKGIGQFLFQWGEQTLLRVIDRCPPDARIAYETGTLVGYAPDETLYQELGYEPVRYFLRMVIEMTEQPPAPKIAQGFSIRTYRHPDEIRALAQAVDESFSDHYGYIERPLEQSVERWEYRISSDKLFDAQDFFLAIEDATGEIVGISLTRSEEWGTPEHAYVLNLGVRPAYRKKGLGLALLHHTFNAYWERGRSKVALHVDADSITGATRLYAKAGMHEDKKWVSYEKVLRDGVELARKS